MVVGFGVSKKKSSRTRGHSTIFARATCTYDNYCGRNGRSPSVSRCSSLTAPPCSCHMSLDLQSFSMNGRLIGLGLFFLAILSSQTSSQAAERTEPFDIDPLWDGHNNRTAAHQTRKVRQDFGYSMTSHFG